jgi:dsRNA-specific ribonuclease
VIEAWMSNDSLMAAPVPTKPKAMGHSLTPRDEAGITATFGGLPPRVGDAIALRDARGKHFQRLEFLGDAVLNLIALRHLGLWRMHGITPRCCEPQPFITTDHALGIIGQAKPFKEIPDWAVSPARSADLVEATVGAAYLSHGWQGAIRLAELHVHPKTLDPPRVTAPIEGHRVDVLHLGAQVLSTYYAVEVFTDNPGADEGVLSELRTVLDLNSRRASLARTLGYTAPAGAGDRGWADQLDHALGTTCATHGIARAIKAATTAERR